MWQILECSVDASYPRASKGGTSAIAATTGRPVQAGGSFLWGVQGLEAQPTKGVRQATSIKAWGCSERSV
jgi:hypothetical protein